MPVSVKVCAIAKDEGPYLVDWVFHHLHFGAEAVEVWVNGTEDTSLEILRHLAAAYPQVSFRDADDVREESRSSGSFFQYDAYARMAGVAREQGFSHVAFLDLDEYWVPRDFATPLPAFLPEQRRVNVVSFPWCLEVPDAARRPFDHPLSPMPRVQLDHHVKSVVRPDDRVREYRPHTARTRAGRRLLVRDPFPMLDKRGQQWGSLMSWTDLVGAWDTVPEAFVLHAQSRSQVEYVASLRRTGQLPTDEADYRANRDGFGMRARPVLDLDLPAERVAAYFEARDGFLARVGADALVDAARETLLRRADTVAGDVVADPALGERLGLALRGVDDERIAGCLPRPDYRLEWYVDEKALAPDRVVVTGWLFPDVAHRVVELGARDAAGRVLTSASVDWTPRPEVSEQFLGAPLECGFRAVFDVVAPFDVPTVELVARPVGATAWQTQPSRVLAARPT